jgi:hypothetical protein
MVLFVPESYVGAISGTLDGTGLATQLSYFYSFQNPPLEPSRELWMGRGLPHSSPVFIRSSILRWSHLGYFGWDGVKIISLYGPSTKADVRTEKKE